MDRSFSQIASIAVIALFALLLPLTLQPAWAYDSLAPNQPNAISYPANTGYDYFFESTYLKPSNNGYDTDAKISVVGVEAGTVDYDASSKTLKLNSITARSVTANLGKR